MKVASIHTFHVAYTNIFVMNMAMRVSASPICTNGLEIALSNYFFQFNPMPFGGTGADAGYAISWLLPELMEPVVEIGKRCPQPPFSC